MLSFGSALFIRICRNGEIAEKILKIEDLYAIGALWLISLARCRVELDLDG